MFSRLVYSKCLFDPKLIYNKRSYSISTFKSSLPSFEFLCPNLSGIRNFSNSFPNSSSNITGERSESSHRNTHLLRELRARTGSGYVDCAKALAMCKGDIEIALQWLREKGIAKATSKASRFASEGQIAIATSPDYSKAVMLEMNSETDFVSRGATFINLVKEVASTALSAVESTKNSIQQKLDVESVMVLRNRAKSDETIATSITNAIAKLGENIQLRRISSFSLVQKSGIIVGYIHGAPNHLNDRLDFLIFFPFDFYSRRSSDDLNGINVGRMGALIALSAPHSFELNASSDLVLLGKKLATQIVGCNPQYLFKKDVPLDIIEQYRKSSQNAMEKEDNEEVRIQKLMEELVLMEQEFVFDNSQRVKDIIKHSSESIYGTPFSLQILSFERYSCGEGMERKHQDFAKEVEALVKPKSQS